MKIIPTQIISNSCLKNRTSKNWGVFLLLILAGLLTQPKAMGSFGIILWFLLGILSFKKVEYTVFYLVLSQILPDIVGVSGNLAQWAIIIWIIYRVFSKRKINLEIIKPIILYLLPLLIWLSISAIANGEFPFYLMELIKGTVFSFIVFDALQDRKIDFVEIGFYIILACLFASLPFWTGDRASLNEAVGFGGGNRGFSRIEGFRGNANFVMVVLCFALVGVFHHWLQAQFTGRKTHLGSFVSFTILIIICIPPLISTQSRTPFIVIAIMLLLTIIFEVYYFQKFEKLIFVAIKACVVVLIIILALDFFLPSWLSRIQDLIYYQSKGGSFFYGRSSLWISGFNIVLDNPLFGTSFTVFTELTNGLTTSHNTIIDSGIMSGIPGMILTLIYLSSPILISKKNIYYGGFRLFLSIYMTGLIISMSIGLQGNKIMYILWTLLFSIEIYRKKGMKFN